MKTMPRQTLTVFLTAVTLAEALNAADAIRDDDCNSSDRVRNDLWFILSLGDSRLSPIPLSSSDKRRLKRARERAPFHMSTSGGNGDVMETAAHRDNLRAKWLKERSECEEATDGEYAYSRPSTFHQVVDEAVAWHEVNPHIQVRRCFTCWRWFSAQKVGDFRFCTDHCHKKFNNAKRHLSTFHCDIGDHSAEFGKYSGLCLHGALEGELALDDSVFEAYGGHSCTNCVHKMHPEWDHYIRPLLYLFA